jgi:hypothetical protein
MVTYDPVVFGLDSTLSNPTGLATGQRESTLTEGEWQSEPLPECAGCPAHVSEGGTHPTVGRHYCTANTLSSPLAPQHQFPFEFIRRMQNYLSYQNWLVNGWRAANPGFRVNAIAMNNFATWFIFKIVGASGRTLTLEIDDYDPRDVPIFFASGRSDNDDPFSPLETSTNYGLWCQVGDQVDIGGNSVVSGRISCRIVAPTSFPSVDYPAPAGTTFTITVDQDVSYATLKADPDSEDAPKAFIYREAFQPELWETIADPTPMACLFRTVEFTPDQIEDGIITLLNPEDENVRIAYPIYDREVPPGYTGESNVRGTFKLEINYGAGYQEINIREWDGTSGNYSWPRIAVTHITGGYKTELWLGAVGPLGQTMTNLINESVISVRVYFGYEVANLTVEGARSPCQGRCGHDVRDFSNTVSGITTNGVDGNNYYCNARKTTPKLNLDLYRGNACFQMGTCPNFIPATPGRISPYTWSQLYCEQNTKMIQLFPGSPHPSNFAITRNSNPSFHWLANPPEPYVNPRGYYAWTEPFECGKFGFWSIFVDEDDNSNIVFQRGAIYNYDSFVRPFLIFPTLFTGDSYNDMKGLFPRKTSLVNHTQLENTAYGTDSLNQRMSNWWRGIQAAASVFRDARDYGPTISFSNRSIPGIEGQNRIQRFNRSTVAYIPKIDKSILEYQPRTAVHCALVKTSPATIDGFDYQLEIQLRADGQSDYGAKRTNNRAVNALIKRVESLGDKKYRIHYMVAPWTLSNGVLGGDELYTFYGGGNMCQLTPDIFGVRGHYQTANDNVYGGPFCKTIPGDTIKFKSHPGINQSDSFYVLEAEPCSGDSVIGLEANNILQFFGRPGVFFDPPEDQEDYVIDSFEVGFTTGTGAWQAFPIFRSSSFDQSEMRPVENDIDDIALLWSNEDLGSGSKLLQYTDTPTDGQLLTIDDGVGFTTYIFVDPQTEYIGSNIPIGIGMSADHSFYNLVSKINSSDPYASAIINTETDEIVIIPRNNPIEVTNTLGIDVLDAKRVAGSNIAYISFASYWWASLNGDVPERICRINFHANGVPGSTEKAIDGCYLDVDDADSSDVNSWLVGYYNSSGEFITYEYHGLVTSNLDFDVPMGKFAYNSLAGSIVFHPNESGKVFFVQYTVNTPIDLGDFPPSRDYPPRFETGTELDYLKKCDTTVVRDEDGVIATNLLTLENVLVEPHTDGVIRDSADVIVEWSEYQSDTWTVIPSSDVYVNRAKGKIRISPEYFATLPDIFCIKVTTDIANRTIETPAELVSLTLQHANALDTIVIAAPFNNGFYFSFGAEYYLGATNWVEWNGDSGWRYPTNAAIGWYYGYPFDYQGGLNDPVLDRETLILETPLPSPPEYVKMLEKDEGKYSESSGNINDSFVYIGADTTNDAAGGLGFGEKQIPTRGGGAGMSTQIFFIEFQEFLKRIPTDAEIISANVEVTLIPNVPEKPSVVTKTTRKLLFCQSSIDESTSGINPLDNWICIPHIQDGPYEVVEELEEDINCGFGLIGLTNNDVWEYLGSFLDSGALMSVGKKRVVSCKKFLEALLGYRNSKYKQFGVLVTPKGDSSAYTPPNGPNSKKFKSAVTGIRESYEDISSTVVGSLSEVHFPVSYEDIYGEVSGTPMYQVRVTYTSWQIECGGFGISNMVVTYKLPDSSITTRMMQGNMPGMQPITT